MLESLQWERLFRGILERTRVCFWNTTSIWSNHSCKYKSCNLSNFHFPHWKMFSNNTYFIRGGRNYMSKSWDNALSLTPDSCFVLIVTALAEHAGLIWAEEGAGKGQVKTSEKTVFRGLQAVCYHWKHFSFNLFFTLYVYLSSFILLLAFFSPHCPYSTLKGK